MRELLFIDFHFLPLLPTNLSQTPNFVTSGFDNSQPYTTSPNHTLQLWLRCRKTHLKIRITLVHPPYPRHTYSHKGLLPRLKPKPKSQPCLLNNSTRPPNSNVCNNVRNTRYSIIENSQPGDGRRCGQPRKVMKERTSSRSNQDYRL